MSLKKIPIDTNHIVTENYQKIPNKVRTAKYPSYTEETLGVFKPVPKDMWLKDTIKTVPFIHSVGVLNVIPTSMYLREHFKSHKEEDTASMLSLHAEDMYLREHFKELSAEDSASILSLSISDMVLRDLRLTYKHKDEAVSEFSMVISSDLFLLEDENDYE